MPARVREVSLATRTARTKLAARVKPYYRRIGGDLHLGYYRPATKGLAGSWIARRYLGAAKYETAALGAADDVPEVPADGTAVLTFDQAQRAAVEWSRQRAAAVRAAASGATNVTVRSAVDAYVAIRKARAMKAGRDAELRLSHHVLAAPLADTALLTLTDGDLARWRSGIARGGRGKPGKAPLAPATLARLLNDLRAALTAAARKAKAPADLHTTIKDGLRPPEDHGKARPKQVLQDADVRKLAAAAEAIDADFGALVMILAATGARLDQAARITVADFQPEARRVMVPPSRKGRGQKQVIRIAVPLPDDVIARLRPLTAGRAGHEPLLTRWHHRQVEGDKAAGTLYRWERVDRRPWANAATMTRQWQAAVASVGLPADLVPYCLRHSSIVRGLRSGLPAALVAKVHDTSVGMIEKHYGAFIVDASEDLLRRAVVPMASATTKPFRTVS
jgi:integrase